jgi:hypothetical protein
MNEREYQITIAPDGVVTLEVHGHKGRGCLDVVKLFEKIVGEQRSLQHTREFYEPEEQVQYRVDRRC